MHERIYCRDADFSWHVVSVNRLLSATGKWGMWMSYKNVGQMQNVSKGRSRRTHRSVDSGSVEAVLQASAQSPRKPVGQCFIRPVSVKSVCISCCGVRSGNLERWKGWVNSNSGVTTPIFWLSKLRLLRVGRLKEHSVRQKTKNTARPEGRKTNFLCCYSTTNNARSVTLCYMSSTIHQYWWSTFWTQINTTLPFSPH
jgi:hypothetical protein